jgi:hypothetical protein
MKRFLPHLLFLIPAISHAQFGYVRDQNIPVRNADGSALSMPWGGGINAAQYNTFDLNEDGKEDLVLFDRMANKIITFINENNTYRYAPEYETFFPDDVTNWVLMRDYNCDGKKDLFTGDILGIKVYTNTSVPGGSLSWKKFFFFTGPGQPKQPVILTQGFTNLVNLQLQFDDLPVISDMDGDGDLDIMSMRYAGEGSVEYHKNLSKEDFSSCDSLKYKRITQKWGNFKECTCGEFAFNGADCPPEGGRTEHAGGKSLLVLDVDGDADMDLLLSEASCTKLYLLKNEGTTDAPVVNSSSAFPVADPIDFYIFPAGYYEDVDFDGVKDLIATPNIYARTFFNTNLSASNWFYKNTGTTQLPSFSLIKTNLLQEQMIDVGDNSIPAFADYDGDNDLDLFVSQNTSPGFVSTICLFENTGSASVPEFKMITNNYLSLSQLNLYNLKISFSDLNIDGKKDLIFTGTILQGNTTRLYYLANKDAKVFNFTGQTPQPVNLSLFYNENVSVTDIDIDGKNDLLIGKNDGSLAYYKNEGALNFTLKDPAFLGFGSSTLRQNLACAVADLDGNGADDLLYGDQSGFLKIINDFRKTTGNAEPISELIYNSISEKYEAHNLGGRLWPAIANLNNTDKPAIVVGNTLGGLQIFKNEQSQVLPEVAAIELYPNPVRQDETLFAKLDRPGIMEVYSSLGQKIKEPLLLLANHLYSYKVSDLSRGVYFFRFTFNDKSYTRRIVIY